MNHLSPSARELVRAGVEAARPSEADRERLAEALRTRLGDAALLEGAATVVSQGGAGLAWGKAMALTVGLGVVLGGLIVAVAPAARPAGVASAARVETDAAPIASLAPAPISVVEPARSADTTAPKQEVVEAPASTGRRSPDRLAQEVALLSRATSELRAGRASEALKTLSEHQSRFPQGVLGEERRAARAQALCALGRRSEAEAELLRLARTSPQSPQAARARQLCNGTR